MNTTFSIILPIYNVKNYIDKCLHSIVNQTYRNIEIIAVIDGSTDGSNDIVEKWADNDNRIQVVYQKNQGSGPARNNGLKHATGEYIIFVDPDDWVDNNMVETLLELENRYNADLILTDCRTIDQNGNLISPALNFDNDFINGIQSVRQSYIKLLGMGLLGAPTKKLYKAEIIKKFNIQFPNLRRSQDIVFNYRYYNYVQSVLKSNCVFYNYRVDMQTYNSKLKKDYYKTLDKIYREIIDLCSQWCVKISKDDYSNLCNYFFHSVIANIESNIILNEDIRKLIENETIQMISNGSTLKRLDQRLLRKFILKKNLPMVRIVSLTRYFLKKLTKNTLAK